MIKIQYLVESSEINLPHVWKQSHGTTTKQIGEQVDSETKKAEMEKIEKIIDEVKYILFEKQLEGEERELTISEGIQKASYKLSVQNMNAIQADGKN